MLNYITQFESVQTMAVFGIGVILLTFAIGFNIRRAMMVSDVKEENDHRRKIEWHNIQSRPLIENKKGGSSARTA